ncbi:MAG: type II toxin-antitoxin system VapC family toxin [Deltaproteobacteria bacterium]|nr:type II toxin-antitoxin system VapC family toxin [Deltaproteobacteria bacterium]
MKTLLDTHVFLWLLTDDERLSSQARQVYLDPKTSVYLSAASFWEIGIKISLGKLTLKEGWLKVCEEQMQANAMLWLPIEKRHCEQVSRLPFHHRDPFDRMLVAQAQVEDLVLVSSDVCFPAYGLPCLW